MAEQVSRCLAYLSICTMYHIVLISYVSTMMSICHVFDCAATESPQSVRIGKVKLQ